MPPVSQQQRRAMYAAKAGKSKLGIPQKVGAEFVEAGHGVRGLPGKIGERSHDRPLRLGFAHAGTTEEGPDLGRALTASQTFSTGNREDAQDFAHGGTTREGPNWRGAAKAGATAGGPTRGTEPKAFANSGTTREGYYTTHCATDTQTATAAGTNVTRPKIRRKSASREHSGGSTEGFRTNTRPSRDEHPDATSHYGTNLDESQSRERNPYSAKRPGQASATIDMGVKPSPSPVPPGRQGRHAFKMTTSRS